jgi:hypothetical protein
MEISEKIFPFMTPQPRRNATHLIFNLRNLTLKYPKRGLKP